MQLGDESMSVTLFDQQPVRRVWNDERWCYSVIDVVAVLVSGINPRKYWFDMKRTIKTEGFLQLSEKIRQLKLRAPDGKMRETDCADTETLLRIVQSIPSPKAEPFKQWLASLGADVIEDHTEDQRRLEYRGEAIVAKRRLHDEVHGRGVRSPKAHAELEARGHEQLYGGETPAEAKVRKGIASDADLGEWMGSEEIIDNSFRDAHSRSYIQRLDITGKEPVIAAHERVSAEVRRFIIADLHSSPPEHLPTPRYSLTHVRHEEERRRTRGMDLFPVVEAPEEE